MKELHLAAYNADAGQVRNLLQAGGDPNGYDEHGYTPLLWAAFRGAVGDQLPVVQALLEAGADIEAVTRAGDSTVSMLAVQSGNEALVRALAERGAGIDRPADEVTPLMVAARRGDLRMVQTLLGLGADPKLRAGSYRAADYARYGGHDPVAELLGSLCEDAPTQ